MSNIPKFNTQDPEAVEIRRKVAAVGMELYDVTTLEAVREFERQAGVKLPEDYVWFITNVGNGGVWHTDCKYPVIPLTTAEKALFACSEDNEEKYALCVMDCGFGYYDGIVLKGERFGGVCAIEEGIADESDIRVHSFKEMYTSWLEMAYFGYEHESFFLYYYPGTIEELYDKYLGGKDIEILKSVAGKVSKKAATKEFIDRVHAEFLHETDNDKQTKLCDILMRSGYDDPLSLMKRIFRPENYGRIIWYLSDYYLSYFKDLQNSDEVMDGAELYYPMLVEMLKYFSTLDEFDRRHFEKCLVMTAANPLFNEEDIMDVLTSDNKHIVKCISFFNCHYNEAISNHIKKYINIATDKTIKQLFSAGG